MKKVGFFLVIVGLSLIILIYGPVIKEELRFLSDQLGQVQYSLEADPSFPQKGIKPIFPVDRDFGIVIPKINLNAKIFPEIDSTNPEEYLPILRKGVAQAQGSAYPNQPDGNLFLFGHSTDAFYNVGRYNAVFHLIGKLNMDEEVVIFYQGDKYLYKVIDKKVVAPEGIAPYLEKYQGEKILTLQTCYPPGTTLKRLLVIAKEMD